MINKVLVANRGEIAVRIIRACRELGIRTVTVFSEVDRDSLHAQIADEALCIGPANSKYSYLNMKAILSACEVAGVDAIHPGFGFLSENASFVKKCELCGFTFIGPSAYSIELMGDKSRAKETMKKAGIPVIPGSDGIVSSLSDAFRICNEIGYPVMIKASSGGGGKGIRLVNDESGLEVAFFSAKQEAVVCFGNSDVYIEKFIERPRHIEIQVIADKYGNVIHLGERDCSIQRKNQKILEEAPSPFVSDELRKKMGEDAKKAVISSKYYNAGTIEFLVDKNEQYYFMEMNTRIQVEHPITEFVTGIDIVKQQILIANNKKLLYTQDDISIKGHSIECRINAENPKFGFRPSPGVIKSLHIPGGPGVRIDSGIYSGYEIKPFYDSMLAKLIVYAPDRESAISKMKSALVEFLIEGVDTNIDFHIDLLRDSNFEKGDYDIGFLDKKLTESGF